MKSYLGIPDLVHASGSDDSSDTHLGGDAGVPGGGALGPQGDVRTTRGSRARLGPGLMLLSRVYEIVLWVLTGTG